MKEWDLVSLEGGIDITAGEDALWICGAKRFADPDLSAGVQPAGASRLGQMLPYLVPQLLELDLATVDGNDVRIKYEDFVGLREKEIDAFDDLFEKSPFTLEVKTLGSLGFASNSYNVRFHLNGERVEPDIRGCLALYEGNRYLLDRKAYELLVAANAFNDLPAETKTSPDAFSFFAGIKELAIDSKADVDMFMERRQVVVPSEIGVELIQEDNDRISFAPKIEGVDNANFQAAVRRTGSALSAYSFDGEGQKKVTVVLNSDQKEVVERIRKVSHLSGVEKTKALRDPAAIFDGVMESVNLDDFGPRVRGIGDFPFIVQPFISQSVTGIFDDVVRDERGDNEGSTKKFKAGLVCKYADGREEVVDFASVDAVNEFANLTEAAWKNGDGQVEYNGKSIAIDKAFIDGVRDLRDKFAARPEKTDGPQAGRYLLIYTNEDEVEFEEDAADADLESELELPQALKDDVQLKDHQRKGVAWLQHNFRMGRLGCLLADDMGLGKTLQLLIFLAWVIERQSSVISDTGRPELPPWKPILIVAPLILIESQTWIGDMQRFFKNDGAIFMPWLTLRGSDLNRLKKGAGQETTLGDSVLDLDQIRQHRVVLTNYETIVNYQHSFAKMRDNWSVVVTDEAQAYKTPNTKVSHALKSLSPAFRVACTGTPVETRLFDVWNIFDFLQPGNLLGSAKDFRDNYECPLHDVEESRAAIGTLKERLNFGKRNAFILRRDKQSLTDLPQKHQHKLECDLSPAQFNYHQELLRRAGRGGEGNHPFALINEFLRVYQHPSLVPHYLPQTPSDALDACPKLQALVETLESIRQRKEKALIFTRSLDMQQILVSVLKHSFSLPVSIINGSTKRSATGASKEDLDGGDRTRRGIIDRFRRSVGFDVLILSPEVAGMGLTLTEANHVFHYGRWWNPAKEAQATDRVYRIGQEKDVNIYYLIAKDRESRLVTFDEKLDILLNRRLALAADFLSPAPAEEDLRSEFISELFGNQGLRQANRDD